MKSTKIFLKGKCVNKILYSIFALIMICVCFTFTGEKVMAANADVVDIPDPNFKALLNETLGIDEPTSDITKGQLASISSLSMPMVGDSAITDFTGISYCTSLVQVSMYGNSLETNKPLISKSITDELRKLTEVEVVFLSNLNLEDYSFIENYTKLEGLYLYGTSIKQLPNFNNGTPIKRIEIQDCAQLFDVKSLSKLSELTVLSMNSCPELHDISSIAGLTSIKELTIPGIKFTDDTMENNLKAIASLVNVKLLYIASCDITDEYLSVLSSLENIIKIDLGYNEIAKIDILLSSKDTLKELYLDHTNIDNSSSDILVQLTNLTSMDLSYSRITDYTFVNCFEDIRITATKNYNEYFIPYYKEVPSTIVVKNVVKDETGNYVAPLASNYYDYNEETNEITVYLDKWKSNYRVIKYEFEVEIPDGVYRTDTITVKHEQGFDLLEHEDLSVGEDKTLEKENASIYEGWDLQWYKDGKKIKGAKSHTLTIEDIQVTDTGRYTLEGYHAGATVVLLDRALVVTEKVGLNKAEDGKWYYYTANEIDITYTGLAKNEYGWWYVKNGKLDITYTGLAKNEYGWWYVKAGKLDKTYTGLAKNEYGWWYVKNGKLDRTYTGLAKNEYGWWHVTNGKLDRIYTGISRNEYGQWYVINGKLDTTYTGTLKFNGIAYNIKAGKVI